MANKKLFVPIIAVILLTALISFVYVLAQEQATITNSGNLILTTTEEKNLINYKFDWGETTITLYKEDNVFANNYIQNKENGKGWKFGATDDILGTATYKYILSSTDKLVLLEKQRFNEKENLTYNYPVVYNYHSNPEDEWNEFRHVYDFEDVCSKNYSQCEWLFNGDSLELTFVSDGNIDPEIENVSSCRTLDAANQYYQLNKSITASGDCIIISSNNITLDLNGYKINSSTIGGIENYGITFLKANSSTIKNGYINNFYVGVYVNDGDENNVTNLTIKAVGDFLDFNSVTGILVKGDDNFISSNVLSDFDLVATEGSSFSFYAISIMPDTDGVSNNTLIQKNLINNNNNGGTGNIDGETFLIRIQGSTNSLILNNIMSSNTGSNSLYGIYVAGNYYATSNSTIMDNNAIGDGGGNTFSYGIYLYSSDNNYITSGSIDSFDYGVYLISSKNNFFSDFDFIYPEVSVSLSTNSTNNTFLNVSNQDNENVEAGSELICKWYYRAYVNDTLGLNVSGANVTAFNVSNAYQFNLTTDSTGFTQLGEIIDYVNNGGTRSYYSLYNITARNSSYLLNSHTYNTTLQQSNYKDVFTLTGISTCGSLTQANKVYTLQNAVTASSTTCFNIAAQNITLDCQGYGITYCYACNGANSGYGIFSNQYNTSIKNCNIEEADAAGTYDYAIYFLKVNNSLIFNSTVSTLTYSSAGIYLETCSNNNILDNIVTTSGSSGTGIYLSLSSNSNTVSNNTITTSAHESTGIYLSSSSNSNTVSNNTIITSNSAAHGIYLESSLINSLSHNKITTSNESAYGINLYTSSNNNVLNSNISAVTVDVNLASTSINNTFLNCSYNISKESVASGSQLIRKWYYQAKVNDTLGNNISNASVLAYNSSGALILNLTTNESGWTNISSLIDYINNGGTRSYYFNYTINATHPLYQTTSHTYNITETTNVFDVFTLLGLPLNVTLNFPQNNSILKYTNVTFNCSSTDDYGLKNVSLYFKSNETKFVVYIGNRSTWKHNDSNVWPGNGWFNPSFSDSAWPSGAARLANGVETGSCINTSLKPPSPTNAYSSYYFRQNFTVSDASNVLNMSFAIDYDDGYVVYLNGHEISRSSNMNGVDTSNHAANATGGHNWMCDGGSCSCTGSPDNVQLNSTHLSYLVSGTNYLAVLIKNAAASTDVAFLLQLTGRESVETPWHANQTKEISGLRNETTFQVNLTDNSTYEWNCKACDTSNNCNFSTSNYTFIINSSYNDPPQIILQYPSPSGVTGIPRNVTLNVTVIDPEGTSMNVTFYGREKNNTNFTIIVLPDTQFYSQDYPQIFTNQTRWINSSKNNLNIVFVTHEGDIVNTWNSITQWNNSNNSMSVLDGQVPYGVGPGNHDMDSVLSRNTTFYNTYFPVSRFNNSAWWGGNFSRNDNNYQLFSAGGQDFIIIHLEACPRTQTITWANETLQKYSNRTAIITTHGYINTSADRNVGTCGSTQYIWDQLIYPNLNVFLVLNGHTHGEARRTDNNIAGKPVHQLLADYQDYTPYRGNGFLRIMKFVPAEKKIYVKTYSPYLTQATCTGANQTWRSDGCYENDTNSEFTLDYSPFNQIGQHLNVASNTNATFLWKDLKTYTTFEWYTEVVDSGGAKTLSYPPPWNFTTGAS